MISTNDFCKKEYGMKLYKISFDAGFSCPNRDGKISHGGCIFCSEGGAGDFAVKLSDSFSFSEEDIAKAKEKVSKKFKGDKYIAYFQAYTNTYADTDILEKLYMPVVNRDDIAVLSIATRPDCLSEETYELLDKLNKIKPVWVELGLQTTKKNSIELIRRGYDTAIYDKAVKRLNKIGIHTITHVILYLPGESLKDMHNTIRHAVSLGSKGIKLQLLHVLKGTELEAYYESTHFHIPSLTEYTETIKSCLELLPENMVVHRLTGDAPKKLLIEPKWSADKKNVINTINEAINPTGPYYVYMLKCNDGSFYTGSSNDVKSRFSKHAKGQGCKYSKSHLPVELIYVEALPSKRAALQREYAIKQLSKANKIALLNTDKNIVKAII